jgi:hypothetical protein
LVAVAVAEAGLWWQLGVVVVATAAAWQQLGGGSGGGSATAWRWQLGGGIGVGGGSGGSGAAAAWRGDGVGSAAAAAVALRRRLWRQRDSVTLSSAMVIDGLCHFIEGSGVRSHIVYVQIASRFFFFEEGAIFNCT